MKLPLVASQTVTQLQSELDNSKTPERAVSFIAAIDHLAQTLSGLADENGIPIGEIPLRYSWGGRHIIGAGRKFHGGHAYVLVGNLLAANGDLASRICRMIRNACISSGSPNALSFLAEALEDYRLDNEYEGALSELRGWNPHNVTAT